MSPQLLVGINVFAIILGLFGLGFAIASHKPWLVFFNVLSPST